MSVRRLVLLAVALLLGAHALGVVSPQRALAEEPATVYVPETGHHISEPFLSVWRSYDLAIIGYPVSEPFERDGMIVQYFERAVFEQHPENAGTPYEVLLERLGSETTADRAEPAFQPLDPDSVPSDDPERRFYVETGHTLGGVFAGFWDEYGGLPVFGYPISEEFTEDGRLVQNFERARFESWPENAGTRYEVLLGHLGKQAAASDQVDIAPVERRDGVPDYNVAPRGLRIPVLMYHRFGEVESRYEMSYWRFDEELSYLASAGYTTVTMAEVHDYMYNGAPLPENPVMITFDDGFASQWQAAAMLDQYGMCGVFFITLDQPRMSDDQLRDLAARGHEIGSHTHTHPDLTLLSDEALAYEVGHSRQMLLDMGIPEVDFLAYPYGAYDWRVIDAAVAAGYRGAVAAWGGHDWTPDKGWAEPRTEVPGFLSLYEFDDLLP